MFTTRLLAATALCGSLVAMPAAAQAADDAGLAGDIIVTAQRRSERLQDVPASITALSADLLQAAGVNSTTDLARVTPGVTMTSYGGFLQPAIRGITSTGANIGENSNVAMYIDGIYQPQQIATLLDLPDVQQVEILKGPQGALYGQNATGGAILVTSKAPSFDASGRVSASYGNFDDIQLRGFATGPVSKSIAVSLSAALQDRDGFRRHVVTGQRDLGLKSRVVRGKVLFEPADTASITLSAYYSARRDSANYAGFAINNNSIGYASSLAGLGIPLPVPVAPKPTTASQFSADPGAFTRIRTYGGSLRGEFAVGAGTVTSNTGYVNNRIHYLADVDATAVQIGDAIADPLTGKYFTHEMNYASDADQPVSYLVGGFYLNGNETFQRNIFDLLYPQLPPATKIRLGGTNQYARVDKEILAAYAEITWKATDRLTLTAGGRYTSESQRTVSNSLNGVALPNVVEYPGDPVKFNKFTPRITARYAVNPDLNLYASWGRGFKSGVVNTTNFALDPVKPETITSYEAGLKGGLAQGLRFNLAAFYYDYKNLQAVAFVPGKAYITQNAATARVKGVDFDFNWQLVDGFSLSGGAAVLDAQYTSFPNAAVFQPTGTGNLQVTADLSGGRLLRSPKFSGNLAANYEADLAAGKLSAFASLYYNSGFALELSNRLRQGEYASVDAELAFAPHAMPGSRIALWGKNLTNKAIFAQALASNLSDYGSYQAPRTYGVRLEYVF